MFPRRPRSAIEEALSNNLDDINGAISDLLDDDIELIEGIHSAVESEGTIWYPFSHYKKYPWQISLFVLICGHYSF
jgi:hypothetical protein